jgi:protein-disulfide isomerase
MRRLMFAALLLAGTAHADEPAFTPQQKAAIIDIVRQALKTDPSILRDAVSALQASDAEQDAVAQKTAIANNQAALFHDAADPTAGNPNGDVTVVEFYDPRCPYCRKMLPGIDSMLQKDKGIRIVYKDIPVLGAGSTLEARAILAAANQGAYLKMQSALMTDPSPASKELIQDKAKSLGLDADKLLKDMDSAKVTDRLHANMKLAQSLKVQGTPAFVIGEELYPGMMDVSQLEAAVSDARKHAGR